MLSWNYCYVAVFEQKYSFKSRIHPTILYRPSFPFSHGTLPKHQYRVPKPLSQHTSWPIPDHYAKPRRWPASPPTRSIRACAVPSFQSNIVIDETAKIQYFEKLLLTSLNIIIQIINSNDRLALSSCCALKRGYYSKSWLLKIECFREQPISLEHSLWIYIRLYHLRLHPLLL